MDAIRNRKEMTRLNERKREVQRQIAKNKQERANERERRRKKPSKKLSVKDILACHSDNDSTSERTSNAPTFGGAKSGGRTSKHSN